VTIENAVALQGKSFRAGNRENPPIPPAKPVQAGDAGGRGGNAQLKFILNVCIL
jgi:hypothetical protein